MAMLRDKVVLGGVDKFEPVSCGCEMDHSKEAVGQLIVSGGDARSGRLIRASYALQSAASPTVR
jgi:hypothetical protein